MKIAKSDKHGKIRSKTAYAANKIISVGVFVDF